MLTNFQFSNYLYTMYFNQKYNLHTTDNELHIFIKSRNEFLIIPINFIFKSY
jgi:hypothetical protein